MYQVNDLHIKKLRQTFPHFIRCPFFKRRFNNLKSPL